MNGVLRRREVEAATGLSRSAIYAAIAAGDFPRPIKLGVRAVGWRLDDIDQWFATRPQHQGGSYA
jgi:prophage regulatory protein